MKDKSRLHTVEIKCLRPVIGMTREVPFKKKKCASRDFVT